MGPKSLNNAKSLCEFGDFQLHPGPTSNTNSLHLGSRHSRHPQSIKRESGHNYTTLRNSQQIPFQLSGLQSFLTKNNWTLVNQPTYLLPHHMAFRHVATLNTIVGCNIPKGSQFFFVSCRTHQRKVGVACGEMIQGISLMLPQEVGFFNINNKVVHNEVLKHIQKMQSIRHVNLKISMVVQCSNFQQYSLNIFILE